LSGLNLMSQLDANCSQMLRSFWRPKHDVVVYYIYLIVYMYQETFMNQVVL